MIPKFWASSTACCKVSIILFLRRVVGFKRSVNITVIIIAITTVAWALATIFFTTFACKPVSFYWNKSSHDGQCVSRRTYKDVNIAIAVFGMVTDIVILVVPLPTLWKSQMRKKQKIAVTGVWGIGLLYVVAILVLKFRAVLTRITASVYSVYCGLCSSSISTWSIYPVSTFLPCMTTGGHV